MVPTITWEKELSETNTNFQIKGDKNNRKTTPNGTLVQLDKVLCFNSNETSFAVAVVFLVYSEMD